MKLVKVFNTSHRPVLVPARGGLSVVLGPGELGTVCPEGARGQSAFWKLMTRGVIEGTDFRTTSSVGPVSTGRKSGFPSAA
jgi:hypothetical protein